MAQNTFSFNSTVLEKAKQMVEKDYSRITVKSSGKVLVKTVRTKSGNPRIIIQSVK